MALRPPAHNLADLRAILAKLEKNRHTYNPVSFTQLRHILRRRIARLDAELRAKERAGPHRRAA